jgi:iron complex outermembrane receptor protein
MSFVSGLVSPDAPAKPRAHTKEYCVMGMPKKFRLQRSLCRALVALGALTAPAAFAQTTVLPTVDVWASRTDTGIVGASTSVITAEDIARSPGATLQDLLSREAGVQTFSTSGAKNGAGTTVDLRGFGATAASNTLVLLNGRRLTDIDSSGIDFSTIPRDSIERIEITRGNSGAVLYGDGAVGGVINIITKTGVDKPPSARVEAGFGSFNQRELNASTSASHGPFAVSVATNAVNSDGYRVNDYVRQRNAIADLRYTGSDGKAWLNLASDDQQLGLPGARLVTLTSSELDSDRRGATTPTAFSKKSGNSLTFGVSRTFGQGVELILDGNLRRKDQTVFSSLSGFDTSDVRTLTGGSVTPRAIIDGRLFGMATKITTGFDYYNSSLEARRSVALNDPAYDKYNLNQQSVAGYWQQSLALAPTTDISWGGRLQRTKLSASDIYDPTAPGAFSTQATPLDTAETNYALHLGAEHRFSPGFAVFGRVARSFRTPNVDERIGVNAFPVDFKLKTQTSVDFEAGVRGRVGPLEYQSSVYQMLLNNEILYIPFPPTGANINLDPTKRFGVENAATWHLSDDLRVKGGLTYTRATFREGIYAGNDVPLVSRWTGNVGLSWNIYQKLAVFDAVVNYVGERRMDNDQANFQPTIPAHVTVDLRLGGEYQHLFWSASVQNLFDVQYYDYAVASSATYGRYNAYPLPGRTFMVKAGISY